MGWGLGAGIGNRESSLMVYHNSGSSMMHWYQRHNGLHGMHSDHRLGDDRMHHPHSGGMMHNMAVGCYTRLM